MKRSCPAVLIFTVQNLTLPRNEIEQASAPPGISAWQRLVSARVAWSFAAVAAFYIGSIGILPLLGKDEPRYVEVAREMWMRGDWVTPTLGGQAWFEKPALLYWLVMASFEVFGVSEWAARLGPALCGLVTVGVIFWMTRRVEQYAKKQSTHQSGNDLRGLALSSALALASCAGLIAFSHGATFDIVLTATITMATACFFVAELESTPRKRNRLLAGMWASIGLALLAKGLVGVILPAGILGLYFVLRRDWRGAGRLKILWGLPLALAVAAVWYEPIIARHGQVFINEFFVQHHFARYLSNKYRHSQPLYYYLPVMAIFALPWTAFLVSALGGIKASGWREEDVQSKLRVFAVAWLVVPVAFFSLSGSKLSGYILPALPGAMLLVGMRVSAYIRSESGVGCTRITGILLLLLSAGAGIYAHRSVAMDWPGIGAVMLPLLGAGAIAVLMAQRRTLCIGLIVGAMLLSTGILTGFAGVPLGEKESVRTLLEIADAHGYHQSPVWQMKTTQRTAEFYAAGRLTYDAQGEPKRFDSAAELVRALLPGGDALVLVPLHNIKRLTGSIALRSEMVGDNGDIALLRVSLKNGTGPKR